MTKIEVSCPNCGKLQVIEMKLDENQESFQAALVPFESLLGNLEVGHYNFSGEDDCPKCDKHLIVSLNVVSLDNDSILMSPIGKLMK